MNQSINTDSKNSKEPQQKYRLGTVSIKILGGLNWFYRRLTSPSAIFYIQISITHMWFLQERYTILYSYIQICIWYICKLVSFFVGHMWFLHFTNPIIWNGLNVSYYFYHTILHSEFITLSLWKIPTIKFDATALFMWILVSKTIVSKNKLPSCQLNPSWQLWGKRHAVEMALRHPLFPRYGSHIFLFIKIFYFFFIKNSNCVQIRE